MPGTHHAGEKPATADAEPATPGKESPEQLRHSLTARLVDLAFTGGREAFLRMVLAFALVAAALILLCATLPCAAITALGGASALARQWTKRHGPAPVRHARSAAGRGK
jgi:hypothetical protein